MVVLRHVSMCSKIRIAKLPSLALCMGWHWCRCICSPLHGDFPLWVQHVQGCNAAGFDAELARFSALLNELLSHGFDLEAKSIQVRIQK